ncbi:MAG: hypothetical protein V4722_20020 [Bacteroidota bacterium]
MTTHLPLTVATINQPLKNTIRIACAILMTIPGITQTKTISAQKNYCNPAFTCPYGKKHPDNFNAYFNGHLCENFNPQQVDYSKEYFELQTKSFNNHINRLPSYLKYDFSTVWPTGKDEQNGVLGFNYKRIQIHIATAVRDIAKSDIYLVKGQTKVNNIIRSFSGEIQLSKFFINSLGCDDQSLEKCGRLFGSYVLYEDSTKANSGVFKGIFECFVHVDKKFKKVRLDNSNDVAVGYYNRSFVGTWMNHKKNIRKKCIWGDYSLPFTFDFDVGENSMIVNNKYKMNGWQTFDDSSPNSELFEGANGKLELRNKWWLPKRK